MKYDTQRDFVSDYLAPGMALSGFGYMGYAGFSTMDYNAFAAPWRKAKDTMSLFGGLSAFHRRRPGPVMGASEAAVLAGELFAPSGASENVHAAWSLASRKFGGATDIVKFEDVKSLGKYLESRPEFSGTVSSYMNRLTASGATLESNKGIAQIPGLHKSSAAKWTRINKGKKITADVLAKQGLSGRADLATAINALAETMGKGTTVSLGKHAQHNMASSIRFRTNKSLIELPLTVFMGGSDKGATMFLGKHGSQVVTPRMVQRAGEVMPFLATIKDSMKPIPLTPPPGMTKHLDVYMMEKMREEYGRLQGGTSRQNYHSAEALKREILNEVIFESNDLGNRTVDDLAHGFRGHRVRSEVKVVETGLLAERGLEWNQRAYVEGFSRWGKDVISSPQAIEKNVFLNPDANWNRFSFTGAYSQARPDQLARELRLRKGPAGLNLSAYASSIGRAAIGQELKDPEMALRVVSVSQDAWGHIAGMEGLGSDVSRIGAEEFLGSNRMRSAEFEKAFSHSVDLTHPQVGEKTSRIMAMMRTDAELSQAVANNTLWEYIKQAPNEAQLTDMFTLRQGELLGFSSGSEFIEGSRYGGVQRVENVKFVQGTLPSGEVGPVSLQLGGSEIHNVDVGMKFQGTKYSKKTVKGFMRHREFQRRSAMALALSEAMATSQIRQGNEAVISIQGMSNKLFKQRLTGGYTFRSRTQGREYMRRVAGSSFLTTEGAKAIGGANFDEWSFALGNEISMRMQQGPQGQMTKTQWQSAMALAEETLYGKRMGDPLFTKTDKYGVAGQMIRNEGSDPIKVRNALLRAGTDLGIIDARQAGTTLDALMSTNANVSSRAWEGMGKRYGEVGVWNVQAAAQGTPEMLGAFTRGSADERVINAFRMQGMGEVAESILEGTSGKAESLADNMKIMSMSGTQRPDNVVHVDELTGSVRERFFSADPSVRRGALEQLGVAGEEFAIDLGSTFEVPTGVGDKTRGVRYLRPGMHQSGHVGAYATDAEKTVLKSMDASLNRVLSGAAGLGPDPGDYAEGVAQDLGEYFGSVRDATMGKRMAGKHAFAGPLENSVQLQLQSSLEGIAGGDLRGFVPGTGPVENVPIGKKSMPNAFVLKNETAHKFFNLSKEESAAFKKGGSAGRVLKGHIYGTIHRQPIEGLYRAAVTRFASAERIMDDHSVSTEVRNSASRVSRAQVFADEHFLAALGGDFDADQVYLHALDPNKKKAYALAHSVTEGSIAARTSTVEEVGSLVQTTLAEHGFTDAPTISRATNMSIAQHEYQKTQMTIQESLKKSSKAVYNTAEVFTPGSSGFQKRMAARYTEAFLEKQMVGNISNVSNIALRAYAGETTSPKNIRKAGSLLHNLTERIIKAKYVGDKEIASGAKSASRAVDILRRGDVGRSQEFKDIVTNLMPSDGTPTGDKALGDMLSVADDILAATSRFQVDNPELRTMKLFSKKNASVEDLFKLSDELRRTGNMHPAAQYIQEAAGGKVKSGLAMAARSVKTNLGQLVSHFKPHAKWGAIGIGAGLVTSMALGDPGHLNARMDSQDEARRMTSPTGGQPSTPAPGPQTARVTPGREVQVNAVAQKRLANYNVGRNLGALLGPGTSTNVTMNDHRSHVDEDYIMKRMGI